MKIQIDKKALIAVMESKLLIGEIPHGTRITNLVYNETNKVFEAILQYPQFALVKEGEEIPLFTKEVFTSVKWHDNMQKFAKKQQKENK